MVCWLFKNTWNIFIVERRERAQLVKPFPHMHESLSLDPITHVKSQGRCVLQFRSREAETGGHLGHVRRCWPQAWPWTAAIWTIAWLKLYCCWLESPHLPPAQPLLTLSFPLTPWTWFLDTSQNVSMQHWPLCNLLSSLSLTPSGFIKVVVYCWISILVRPSSILL